MSVEKMREDFEDFCRTHGMRIQKNNHGYYSDDDTQRQWGTWQASRASQILDLSQCMMTVAMPNREWILASHVYLAAEYAGMRVKK